MNIIMLLASTNVLHKAIQAVLIFIAFLVTLLRTWIRIRLEHRELTLADYLVWGGWICALGWMSCSIKALYLQIDHPLVDFKTDSVVYLKTVFVSCFFFDVGLYFPKASLIAFYWWLVPQGLRRLRIGVYVSMAFMLAAFIATVLTDTLLAPKISDNWSLENQMDSIWNSSNDLVINWALNFSTDLLLFCLPFFIINCLKLQRRQKLALVGVFSLGIITMAISLARIIVYTVTDYNVDDAVGNAWCTAEMSTGIIVVSLPYLKSLIMRRSGRDSAVRNATKYPTNSNHLSGNKGEVRSHIQGGKADDEVELVFLDRKTSPCPTGDTGHSEYETRGEECQDGKDGVIVTTNVSVMSTRHMDMS
ncbi:hypothetical protein CJF31_00002637 [Rutstroemia sp. NJR-2017a BVV2]|nr:hypothetical protein CJF31_00002637 [Rutstroemia sp. NJR-2017a BVV2]